MTKKGGQVTLSIITVNKNNASGLEQSIRSALRQSFRDYEFIVIDGNSTDESVGVIQKYSDNIEYWISEGDNGVYSAMNKGILSAKGDYCYFLNSGDYLCNETVLESVFRGGSTADVIYGNLLVHSGGSVVTRAKGTPRPTFLDIYSNTIKHQASFIRRSLFEKYGLYDESLRIVADWAFFLNTVGLNSASVQYLDVDISCFSAGGRSYSDSDRCEAERRRVLNQYLSPLMQRDYFLLEKYRGVRWIDHSKLGWFLFRILARLFKTYYRDR